MQTIWITRRPCKCALHVLDRTAVEEIPELLLPQQLAEQVAVERERLRPPLGGGRVVLVHVVGHVVEEKRYGVRRGSRGLDVDEVDLARAQSGQKRVERRQVEDVLQTFAVGLEDDREGAESAVHLEQALGLQALLPERRPLAPPASGRCSAIPSSDQSADTSSPSESRIRAPRASAQGACTRPPNGVRMQTRQSPISSRKRSTTTVRSEGTAPVAASCSRRKVRRLPAARSSRACCSVSRATAFSSRIETSSREASPIASPSSYGRPGPSPFQNGIAPGTPGAGETSTRSRVISSIRHVDAPSMNVCPARAS